MTETDYDEFTEYPELRDAWLAFHRELDSARRRVNLPSTPPTRVKRRVEVVAILNRSAGAIAEILDRMKGRRR